MENRNVFIYWVGKEFKLINLLRNLIYLHSTNGKGYTVHFINETNISEYITDIHPYFYNLSPNHQSDYVRVNVIYKYGGIWMDSDTLVIDSLDSLFDIIDNNDGFFIKENNEYLCVGVFGSKKNTPMILEWKNRVDKILSIKNNIGWTDIGNDIVNDIYNKNNYNYHIFNGLDNIYPINWNKCVQEFISMPYINYKTIIRPYQPFIILVNSVYREVEKYNFEDLFSERFPLNYFIKQSLCNLNLEKEDILLKNYGPYMK